MNKGYEKVKHILILCSTERRRLRMNSYYENPKKCDQCHEIIPYDKKFNDKFCGSSCAAIYNNTHKVRKIKYCLNCDRILSNINGRFCSHTCHLAYRRKIYINEWLAGKHSGLSGESISDRIRNYLLNQCNNKCEQCGWSEINSYTNKVPLTVDRIDGNYKNNVRTNLRVLCPNCHSLTNTYGGLNRGSGRTNRRIKRNLCNHGVNGSMIECQSIGASSILAGRSGDLHV